MKLLVLGATGGTGRHLVSQALAAGHEVTAYVRNPTNLEPNSFRSGQLFSRSMRALAPAMARRGVRRLVLMSSFGVGESLRDAPPLLRLHYRVFLHGIFADKKAAEDYLRTTELDWTFVYPVILTDGPRTGRYRAGERLALEGWPKISRADVADFILGELRNAAYVRKTAVLSY